MWDRTPILRSMLEHVMKLKLQRDVSMQMTIREDSVMIRQRSDCRHENIYCGHHLVKYMICVTITSVKGLAHTTVAHNCGAHVCRQRAHTSLKHDTMDRNLHSCQKCTAAIPNDMYTHAHIDGRSIKKNEAASAVPRQPYLHESL